MSRKPAAPSVLRAVIQSFLEEVHVSIPAKVLAYDKDSQTAKVRPSILRAQKTRKGVLHEKYPIIENVPVLWQEGGGYSLQFPMAEGDHLALLFSEWAYSQWRATGEVSKPGDLTRHDLSYPFAIPGLRPNSSPLPNPGNAGLLTIPPGGSLSVSVNGAPTFEAGNATLLLAELAKIATAINGIVPGSYTPPVTVGLTSIKGSA